jgi:hypothetical protein
VAPVAITVDLAGDFGSCRSKIRENYNKFVIETSLICELPSRLLTVVQNSGKFHQVFADTINWSERKNALIGDGDV